ncbi:hypothetical protein RRG08_003032 [Elysia crispata]|uniref:Uncharacterized protein n=1 Tax=Elysia crispata TaxID=231223 RepID=A0AAE1EBK7_9GAST|nr:hypothetical protein RRG08_003032 [Elysia crispata]
MAVEVKMVAEEVGGGDRSLLLKTAMAEEDGNSSARLNSVVGLVLDIPEYNVIPKDGSEQFLRGGYSKQYSCFHDCLRRGHHQAQRYWVSKLDDENSAWQNTSPGQHRS